jgi:hypothetical protein
MFKVNLDAATQLVKDDIRLRRVRQFEENDRQITLAVALGDDELKISALNRREFLRDVTKVCDGKSTDELNTLLEQSRSGILFNQ